MQEFGRNAQGPFFQVRLLELFVAGKVPEGQAFWGSVHGVKP